MAAMPERQVSTRAYFRPEGKLAQLWKQIKQNKVSYLFVAPYGILFFLFTILPVGVAIFLSFTHYNMLQPPQWVGWENYLRLLLADDVFLVAVKNTFVFAVFTGPLSYLASFVFAWLINDLKPRVRAFLTLLLYAPSLSGTLYLIWTVMFSGDSYGYINAQLLYYGIIKEPIQFLTNPDWMMPVVILIVLWMSLGTSFLAFIAGLQGIDSSLYEAAAVDGIKNRWQELFFITLPQMKGFLMFGAIMAITSSFAAAEQIIPLVGFPSTDYAGHTIVAHLIDYGNVRFEMGMASAIAVILFFAMVITQRGVQRILNKIGT